MLEKSVESAFMRGVRKRKAIAPKCEKLGKGWPDRVILAFPGRICFIELKRPSGKLRRRQAAIGRMLRALGFEWHCLYTKEAVKEFLDEWFDRVEST